jgi:hypothetical protein
VPRRGTAITTSTRCRAARWSLPQLYSKLQAIRELRQLLNIGGQKERDIDNVSKLSDAELIQRLADQAKELGIEINLNYSFARQPTAKLTDGGGDDAT